jgi:hypothetical protein
MPLMISPQEAQAIQEDEAQLVMALAQVSHRISAALHQPPAPKPTVEDALRISLGRRMVYGQLWDGSFRHELTPNSLKVIFDALQKPVTEGVEPEQYKGKVPAIEIRSGETLLFREERDGTVTANLIQLQVGEVSKAVPKPVLKASEVSTPATSSGKEADQAVSSEKAAEVAQIAARLMNPLSEKKPLYDSVAIANYRIKQSGQHLTVSRDDNLVLVVRDGEIINQQLNGADLKTFQQFQAQFPARIPDQGEPRVESRAEHFQSLGGEGAIATLERETAKLPECGTRELLQATLQDWQQQPHPEATPEKPQSYSLRDQRLAAAVLELFNRGYERTGELSYQLGEYTLAQRQGNTFSLSDSQGELMTFQRQQGFGFGRRVQVLSTSDRLNDFQRRELLAMKQNPALMPQGTLDVEATYAAKTWQAEQTVRDFLKNHARANVWSKEGGQFKLEMGAEDLLRITDKQGRGIVYQRQKGEVFSQLNPQDFAHFERLQQRMNALEQPLASPKTSRQPQLEIS